MNLIIHSKNLQITDALKVYVNQKIGLAVEHYFPETTFHVHINLSVFKNNHCIEVTVPIGDITIRAEEQTADMYKSIDLVEEKLKRQFRKYKTRLNRKARKEKMLVSSNQPQNFDDKSDGDEDKVVRLKQFQLKPMSAEEAILQMNLLDHQFFVFQNAENDLMSVVYKRKNGQYGLIASDIVENGNKAI
ncbi:putative sigma-54 modulation protein [Metabacillus crassostreae]|uniref:ribosome hibernation-promoting factor, HPF/YfiA family n=1 Tax=Metabacillus crassostreae TaxID=929098 RepID=UPI00195C0FDF|nr:ribosome-associated translation inhibitor RaiA [Metabacillus crassostreae]MBM7602958.1 putative sigma-54 modulation protein [Metabacillus crassostreae]